MRIKLEAKKAINEIYPPQLATQKKAIAEQNVCSQTVDRDLCIGCGVCAGVCPGYNLIMDWSRLGTLIPKDQGYCIPSCRMCLDVCPFQNHTDNEDTLAKELFGSIESIRHTPEIGYYMNAYVGYANEGFRERGASGGMASWFLADLLEKRIVDHVISVRPKADSECLFEYAVLSILEDVRAASKSAYYPVELSTVLQHIIQNKGRYAVIALPCFVKAIRLASQRFPLLRRRIKVLAGLVCGQMKSKYFSDYLISNMELDPKEITHLSFRSKNPNRPASNFEMQARTRSGNEGVCVWGEGLYAKTWGLGMFTPRACCFCDDTFAETADIAFMDAWLPEYVEDSRGTSIVLVRSQVARYFIEDGIAQCAISMQPMAIEKVIASQVGVLEQKRARLANRLWIASRKGFVIKKRVAPVRPQWFQRLLLEQREVVRRTSLEAVGSASFDGKSGLYDFNVKIQPPCRRLNTLLLLEKYIFRVRTAFSRFIRLLIPR